MATAAEELYIKNRPFEGVVTNLDGQLWVELQPFAQAMKIDLAPNGATLAVGEGTVSVKEVEGVRVIPLLETANLLGAKVIKNKDFGTIDINLGAEAGSVSGAWGNQTPPTEPAPAAKKEAKPAANTLRLHGKITLDGADQIGLFEGGSSTVPYKMAKVDKTGRYTLDIDLEKDLHQVAPGVFMTDIRSFKEGAFEQCHGRCNFLYFTPDKKKLELSPYGTGQTLEINGSNFEFNEEYWSGSTRHSCRRAVSSNDEASGALSSRRPARVAADRRDYRPKTNSCLAPDVPRAAEVRSRKR